MCCADVDDNDRAFINKNVTTDCCCIFEMGNTDANNPILGIACLPMMIVTHMVSFPVACCSPEQYMCYGTESDEQMDELTKKNRLSRFDVIRKKKEHVDENYNRIYLELNDEERIMVNKMYGNRS